MIVYTECGAQRADSGLQQTQQTERFEVKVDGLGVAWQRTWGEAQVAKWPARTGKAREHFAVSTMGGVGTSTWSRWSRRRRRRALVFVCVRCNTGMQL